MNFLPDFIIIDFNAGFIWRILNEVRKMDSQSDKAQ